MRGGNVKNVSKATIIIIIIIAIANPPVACVTNARNGKEITL